jgi:DNA-directed RNA polymerase specialized sigma24 family protein/CheY-like chemotaxis protein
MIFPAWNLQALQTLCNFWLIWNKREDASMGAANKITPLLPYLRRYARALAGNQQTGDAVVADCLEALIADPKDLEQADDPRVELYRAFTEVWESVPRRSQKPALVSSQWENAAQRRLAGVDPKARQAFLLKSVEGFETRQISQILERSEQATEALLASASDAIMDEIKTDILIIEDETMIAVDLELIVNGIGHNVVGIAKTEEEAVAMARAKKPGLVLADIRLADGSSGLDAVNRILPNLEVPVIFITAYPEKLLTGERPEPTFLIAKPFLPETVKAVVSQALFFEARARAPA